MGVCGSSEMDMKVEILQSTPFVYRLSKDELNTFASFFELREYQQGTVISDTSTTPEFIVVGKGSVDVHFDNHFLATKSKGDFFGQVASLHALALERKESLYHAKSIAPVKTNLQGDGGKKQNIGKVGLTERESELEEVRLSTYTAKTDCTCAVLSEDSWRLYNQSVSMDLQEMVHVTMGASASKNLKSLPFLKDVPDRKIKVLSTLLHFVPVRKGQLLFKEGDIGSEMYIVYMGSLRAVAELAEDEMDEPHSPRPAAVEEKNKDRKRKQTRGSKQEVVLNSFKEGDFFGEIALIMDIPRTASILAVEDSLVLELRKDDFQNFLKLTPNLPFHDLMKRRFANHFKKYKVPFFEAIPDNKYPLLASLCAVEQFEPDTYIFREGDLGGSFYIIAHGQVEVFTRLRDKNGAPTDKQIRLTTMGPGKYFGEIALIRRTERTASVKTLTRCVILSITKANFQSFFEEAPEALADFEVKLARYECAMRSVIYHPLGLDYFTAFLEREYSAENIRFWKAARDYRHLASSRPDDVRAKSVAVPSPTAAQPSSASPAAASATPPSSDAADSDVASSPGRHSRSPSASVRLAKLSEEAASSAAAAQATAATTHVLEQILGDNLSEDSFERLAEVKEEQEHAEVRGLHRPKSHSDMSFLRPSLSERRRAKQSVSLSAANAINSVPDDIHKVFRTTSLDTARSHGWSLATADSIDLSEDQYMYQNQYEVSLKKWRELKEQQDAEEKKVHPAIKPKLLVMAKRIVEHFIKQGADDQVNINGDVREIIEKKVRNGDVTGSTFIMAEKEILALIERDSFNRFKASDLFREFLQEAESYDENVKHPELETAQSRDEKLRSGSVIRGTLSTQRPSFVLRQLRKSDSTSSAMSKNSGSGRSVVSDLGAVEEEQGSSGAVELAAVAVSVPDGSEEVQQ